MNCKQLENERKLSLKVKMRKAYSKKLKFKSKQKLLDSENNKEKTKIHETIASKQSQKKLNSIKIRKLKNSEFDISNQDDNIISTKPNTLEELAIPELKMETEEMEKLSTHKNKIKESAQTIKEVKPITEPMEESSEMTEYEKKRERQRKFRENLEMQIRERDMIKKQQKMERERKFKRWREEEKENDRTIHKEIKIKENKQIHKEKVEKVQEKVIKKPENIEIENMIGQGSHGKITNEIKGTVNYS